MAQASSEKELEFAIPPFTVELDGAEVHVTEIVELKGFGINTKFASLWVEWNCYRSPPFHLLFNSEDEFWVKVRVEIAKMKAIIYSGKDHIYQKVC